MKNKFTTTLPLTILAIGALGSVTSANADLNNSIYVSLEAPCRVGDTRGTAAISIPAGDYVEWFAYGIDMSGQGGDATGCPQPKTDMDPTGIAVNITAVGNLATAKGNLVAYAADTTPPTNSVVNYTPGTNIANSTIVGLGQDGKFIIQSNNANVPAIADVQGYFYAQPSGIAQVAKSGGDYSSPVDAMNDLANWCGTPSITNVCLMKIAPGVYTITGTALEMEPGVDIQGSGQNVTLLKGPVAIGGGWSKTNAVVWGASNATLSDLSVENIGGSGNAAAVFNLTASPNLVRVRLEASGAISNAVHNIGSSPNIVDSILKVPTGSTSSTALYSWNGGSPSVRNSYVEGEFGVWTKASTANIWHSYIKSGPTHATVRTDCWYAPNATTNVFASTLDGGAADAVGTSCTPTPPKCAGVTDEGNNFSTGPACP